MESWEVVKHKPAALATAEDIGVVKEAMEKSKAVAEYYRKYESNQLSANEHIRKALECARYIGEWLTENGPKAGNPQLSQGASIRLADLGINKDQSSRWQKLASIPVETWEAELDKRETIPDEKLTQRAMLKLAKRDSADTESRSVKSGGCRIEDLFECEKQYDCVYADPAWSYDNKGTRATADDHYSTMAVQDIADLPVQKLSKDKALLFLWTTNAFIQDSLNLIIPAWGYEFKSSVVWVKPQIGMGNYVRCAHEFLLIATRGGRTGAVKDQISWIEHKRGKHSSKPQVFREIVERVTGEGDWLEMFGREHRPGWDVWGNEVSRQKFLETV